MGRKLFTKGWGEINSSQEEDFKPTITDQEFLLAKLFKSKEGKLVLDYLAELTIEKPTLQSMSADAANTTISMAIREGENNLYRKIKLIINKVEKYGRN